MRLSGCQVVWYSGIVTLSGCTFTTLYLNKRLPSHRTLIQLLSRQIDSADLILSNKIDAPKQVSFVLVMGLPAAGKSTLCQQIQEHLHLSLQSNESIWKIFYLPFDKVIPSSVFGPTEEKEPSNSNWKKARQCILSWFHNELLDDCDHKPMSSQQVDPSINQTLSQLYKEAIGSPEEPSHMFILLDDNFYLASMRREWYTLARHLGAGFGVIYCPSSVDSACQRDRLRDGTSRVGDDVIRRMNQTLEPPEVMIKMEESVPWRSHVLVLTEKERSNWPSISDTVRSFLMLVQLHPVTSFLEEQKQRLADIEVRTKSRETCSRSVLHQVDLHLRACVGRFLKTKDRSWCTHHASLVNEVRRNVLEEVKFYKPPELASGTTELEGPAWRNFLNQAEALLMLTLESKTLSYK